MIVSEQPGRWWDRDPRISLQFMLQLSRGPTRMTDKGTDHSARAVRVIDCVIDRKPECPPKAVMLMPPERGKCQLVVPNGATIKHLKLLQRGEFPALQEIAD